MVGGYGLDSSDTGLDVVIRELLEVTNVAYQLL